VSAKRIVIRFYSLYNKLDSADPSAAFSQSPRFPKDAALS